MEVKDAALPLHTDAEAKIRTRIFLEGNFFVDIKPGTPSAPILPEGDPIPMKQTYSPVQLGDVLRVLKSDVRQDLRTLLSEFSLKGLGGGGAEAFNQTIDYMEPAYKSTSVVTDAALGENPKRDLQRVLSGQQRVAAALNVDPGALQGLVTNVNTTAGALAREDTALQASIPALRDLLRRGYPALASLNSTLPTLRRFAVEALPGVRSTPRTIDATIPFLRQLRKLFTKPELRGLTRQTRAQIPRLVALNYDLRPLLGEARGLSSCANNVLLPWAETASPRPSPATRAKRSAASSTAASSASRARAAPTTATPPGSASGPRPRTTRPPRGRASSRCRRIAGPAPLTVPTCPARPSSRPNSAPPVSPAAHDRSVQPRAKQPEQGRAVGQSFERFRKIPPGSRRWSRGHARKPRPSARRVDGEANPPEVLRLGHRPDRDGRHRVARGRLHPVQPALPLPADLREAADHQGGARECAGGHAGPGPDGAGRGCAGGRYRQGRARGRPGRGRDADPARVQEPRPQRTPPSCCGPRPASRTCSSRSTPATASRSPRRAASSWPTRRPTSTPTRFLGVLDGDTRDYLKLLIGGAGKGLAGRGEDLRQTFKRLEPLHRDLAAVNTSVAKRCTGPQAGHHRLRLAHGGALQEKGLDELVRAGNDTFSALASEEDNLSLAVRRLPGALRESDLTLARVDVLAQELRPTLESLRPAVRRLD